MTISYKEMMLSKEELYFDAIYIKDNMAWIYANNLNGLYVVDLRNYKVTLKAVVPNEHLFEKGLFSHVLRSGKYLVFIPLNARCIAVYDMESGQFESFEKLNKEDRYFGGCHYKNKVFMLCTNAPKIAVFDVLTHESHYVYGVEEWYQNRKINKAIVYFRKDHTVIGQYYYFVCCNAGAVAKLDLEKEQIEFFEVTDISTGLRMMCPVDSDFWIIEFNKAKIIKWNEKRGIISKYNCDKKIGTVFRTGEMICDDKLWIFPTVGDDVISYDEKRNLWEIESIFKQFGSEASVHRHIWGQAFPLAVNYHNNMYVYSANTLELLKYDKLSKIMERKTLFINRKEAIKEYYKYKNKNKIYYEGMEYSLDEFLLII